MGGSIARRVPVDSDREALEVARKLLSAAAVVENVDIGIQLDEPEDLTDIDDIDHPVTIAVPPGMVAESSLAGLDVVGRRLFADGWQNVQAVNAPSLAAFWHAHPELMLETNYESPGADERGIVDQLVLRPRRVLVRVHWDCVFPGVQAGYCGVELWLNSSLPDETRQPGVRSVYLHLNRKATSEEQFAAEVAEKYGIEFDEGLSYG